MKVTIDIKDIPGCEYTVDGEWCENLEAAVKDWTRRGTQFYELAAWSDDKKLAVLRSPWGDWMYLL
jgi:hypothetical protein